MGTEYATYPSFEGYPSSSTVKCVLAFIDADDADKKSLKALAELCRRAMLQAHTILDA